MCISRKTAWVCQRGENPVICYRGDPRRASALFSPFFLPIIGSLILFKRLSLDAWASISPRPSSGSAFTAPALPRIWFGSHNFQPHLPRPFPRFFSSSFHARFVVTHSVCFHCLLRLHAVARHRCLRRYVASDVARSSCASAHPYGPFFVLSFRLAPSRVRIGAAGGLDADAKHRCGTTRVSVKPGETPPFLFCNKCCLAAAA